MAEHLVGGSGRSGITVKVVTADGIRIVGDTDLAPGDRVTVTRTPAGTAHVEFTRGCAYCGERIGAAQHCVARADGTKRHLACDHLDPAPSVGRAATDTGGTT